MEKVPCDIVDYVVDQQLHITLAIITTITVTITTTTTTIIIIIIIIITTTTTTTTTIGLTAAIYAIVFGVQVEQVSFELLYPWKSTD